LLTIWLVIIARRPSASAAPMVAPPRDEPEVIVEVSNIFETYGPEFGPWSFGVKGVNRSDHPIRFTSAGFERPDRKQVVITEQPVGADLIRTVPAHDAGQTWIECDALASAGLDIYGPVVGWVRTATGDLYKSEPKTLRSP
jgi:hypothetical protein